jgi:hypothetical protein
LSFFASETYVRDGASPVAPAAHGGCAQSRDVAVAAHGGDKSNVGSAASRALNASTTQPRTHFG